ncbi:MAG: tRNA epoxyqueuosine(34) reductase QueG [candidate division Zixibacteria bacterium]|nr:tRNA epoxyqueuosine(34) reductase QueG [candidate division Zixibacteria bacterium]
MTKNDDKRILSADFIKTSARELGADAAGIATADPVRNRETFLAWLAAGGAGEMTYLEKYQDQRFNPGRLLPGAQSIIVVGVNYCQDSESVKSPTTPYRVARYALGEDYHRVLRRLLKRLRTRLRQHIPDLAGRICVDTAPFMDKYWANQAGLGWQGKHTNLVSREFGNWLVIGSLIIDHAVDRYDRPHPDHCGNCRRCLDICPTGALPEPYRLDAVRCISYWTIESRQDRIPDDIASAMGSDVFGCDRCLGVCPFNRFSKPGREPAFRRTDAIRLIESGEVMHLTEQEFAERFSRTMLTRSRLSGIIRNIRAVDSHRKNKDGNTAD